MVETASDSSVEELILKFRSTKSPKLRSKRAFEIANKAYSMGQFEISREYLTVARNCATDIYDDKLYTRCMILSGALHIYDEQYDDAKKTLLMAYQLSYEHKIFKEHVRACIYLSDIFTKLGNLEYAYSYMLLAEEVSYENGFTEFTAMVKSRFAHYYYETGNVRKALSMLVALLSDKNNTEYINIINSIGICLDVLGYKGHAILCYQEALTEVNIHKLNKSIGAYIQLVATSILMNIVKFYLESEDIEPLTVYYEQLQKHINEFQIPTRYKVNIEILKAKKLIFENNLEEATQHLTTLLQDSRYNGFHRPRGVIIGTLAEIEYIKGNFESSKKLLEDSMPYLSSPGDPSVLISSINSYASKLLRLGQFDKSLNMAEEVLTRSISMGMYKDAIDANRLIIEISRLNNNKDRELQAFRSLEELQQKLTSSGDQPLFRAAIAHAAISNERDKAQQLSGTISRLEIELKRKNSELQSLGLQVIHTNKLLSDIDKNIHQWQPKELNAHFLKSTVSNYLAESSKIEWETYEKHFSDMYPDFVRLLTKTCPTLTLMEVKVCTLIKSQFTSEKIADILCVSRRTVDSHRYHIRKKLNLESNANLYTYFNQL